MAPLISGLLSGFNSTCFAYGMTGAGKTHTMFGDMYFAHVREPGIVPLALADLFAYAQQRPSTCTLRVSYLEIYNEQVRDLFASRPANRPQGLLLVEDPEKGIVVTDLSEFVVTSLQEVSRLVVEGNSRRTMAATGANQFSTRSHAVLQVAFETRTEGMDGKVTSSKLSLIDLAGSERAAATENRGVRLLEGANINRSLLALGNCINILSDPEKAGKFVPYRDSKLTRLLKDALGGRTCTVMIACVSPSLSAYEETLHTLKYAERARRIKVSATRNVKEVQVHVSEYKAIIAALKAEVETLRQQIQFKDIPAEARPIPQIIQTPQSQGDTDTLGQDLMHNFEEFWELKQSIQEVETLNAENKRQIKALISNLEYIESLNDVEEENRLKTKIKQLHENIRENEEEHSELLQSLQQNLKAKARLQRDLSMLQDDRQRDIIQLEITVRTLKMEKMDLYIQNQEMKQKVVDSQKISEEKEKMIVALRQEVEEMKKQLSFVPRKVEESEVVSEEPSMKSELFPCLESDTSLTRVKGTRTNSMCPLSSSSPPRSAPSDSKPPHLLKISDLNHARALRKSESQKAVNRSQSTEGFISGYISASKGDEVTVLREEQTQNEEPPATEPTKSTFKVSSVVVVSKNLTAMRKVHNIRPIKKYENLQRVRSSSNTRSRGGSTTKPQAKPVPRKEESASAGKASLESILANLHQKILTGEETETLVRKTLKQGTETPMVAISLRNAKPAFK